MSFKIPRLLSKVMVAGMILASVGWQNALGENEAVLAEFSIPIPSSNTQPISEITVASPADSYSIYLPIVKHRPYVPPVIPETTEVLSDATTQYLSSVSADGKTFTFSQSTSELEAVQSGEVIVSDVIDDAPNGFLRTVTSVSTQGGQVVLQTEPATLEDAIQQGAIYISKRLTPADVESMTALPGVRLLDSAVPTLEDSFFFEINDVVLYDKDGNHNTTNDQLKANGSLELAPDFNFDLVVHDWALQELAFVFNVGETTELEFQAEVDLLSVELYYEIARLNLGTITVFVGPVPVVFLIEMPIYLRGDGDVSVGITTSVTQQANLSAGLRYEDGTWTPVSNFTNTFDFDPPSLSAGVDFKGYIDPPLSLLLYGVAGPFAAVTPYLKLEADVFDTPWWKLYGGIDATVGVKAEVLGHSLGDHTEVVIGYKILLAQAAIWQIGVFNDYEGEFDTDPHGEPDLIVFNIGQPDSQFPSGIGTDIGSQRSVIDIYFSGDISSCSAFWVKWSPGGSTDVEQFAIYIDGIFIGNSMALAGSGIPYVWYLESISIPSITGGNHVMRLIKLSGNGNYWDALKLGGPAP